MTAVLLSSSVTDGAADVCGEDPDAICETVLRWWGNETLATAAKFLVTWPLRVTLIVVGAFVVNRLLRRAIRKLTARIATPRQGTIDRLRRSFHGALAATEQAKARAKARAATLDTVLASTASIIVWTIAILILLSEFNVQIGPLVAGAGIAGVALGFGAQSLVRDFLTGIFMLVEDQFGVGDVVDLGEASGVVEAVTLRTTRVRGADGAVWYVPNGEIRRVGNMSQQWARAFLDVEVDYDADVDHASRVIRRVAEDLCDQPEWQSKILDPPQILGVESVGAGTMVIRLVVRTLPSEQFALMRALRARLKVEFAREGIEVPHPPGTVVTGIQSPSAGTMPALTGPTGSSPTATAPTTGTPTTTATTTGEAAGEPADSPGATGDRVRVVHHFALAGHWEDALSTGTYRRSSIDRSLEEAGFVHCAFGDQLREVADRFYAGRTDVVLLTIDPRRVDADVRVEDLSGEGRAYPHVYGPIPVDAVIESIHLPLGDDGRLVLP